MKSIFSASWKSSASPRKQRKYRFNIPMHSRKEQLAVHLSKTLREKHKTRSLSVRTGDKVRVLRGTHKGKEGAVESIDAKNYRVYVAKVEHVRKEGGNSPYPLQPSNLMIVDLAKDKKRLKEDTPKKETAKKE